MFRATLFENDQPVEKADLEECDMELAHHIFFDVYGVRRFPEESGIIHHITIEEIKGGDADT